MTKTVTPLRQRMIDDMTLHNLSPSTHKVYTQGVANFARFFGQSPDMLGLEEVRIFSVTQWCQLLGEAGFSDFRVEPGAMWNPVEWAEVFVEARA